MTGLLRWLYLQLTECLYRQWSPLYEAVAWLISLGHWHEWRLGALDYVVGGRTFELGVGTGRLLPHLARMSKTVVAVDASPQMAHRAVNSLRRAEIAGTVIQAIAQELPLKGECMDSVVCTFPAGYILDKRTIAECRRVLVRSSADRCPSRLVITGLWVDTDSWLLRLFGVFYGRPDMRFLAEYMNMIGAIGYSVAISEQRKGAFRVGTVVAVPKRTENDTESTDRFS